MKQVLSKPILKKAAAAANPDWTLRQWALGGAWFFIVVSALHLVWVIGMKSGSAEGSTKLYHTIVGGVSHDAIGLTYSGTFGLLLAWVQLIALGGATVLSKTPIRKFRRFGHGTLIAWAALWLLNFYWLWSLDGEVSSFLQSGLMTALFSCVVYRAFQSRKRNSSTPSKPETVEEFIEEQIDFTLDDPEITESQPPAEPQNETRINRVITSCRNTRDKCVAKCTQSWKKVQPPTSNTFAKAVELGKKLFRSVKGFSKKNWPRVRDGHEESTEPSDPVTQA